MANEFTEVERQQRQTLMQDDVGRQFKNQARTVEELRRLLDDVAKTLRKGEAPSTTVIQVVVSMTNRFGMDTYATMGRMHAIAFLTGEGERK
jgi:hypothetical protein